MLDIYEGSLSPLNPKLLSPVGFSKYSGKMEHKFGVFLKMLYVLNNLYNNVIIQVILTCPDGWTQFLSSCYYFSQTTVNFLSALATCRDMGADLVLPLTEEETRMIKSAAGPKNYWIDLKLERKHYNTKSGLPPAFTKWRAGEPNNFPADECVVFVAKNEKNVGGWDSIRCSRHFRYICKMY